MVSGTSNFELGARCSRNWTQYHHPGPLYQGIKALHIFSQFWILNASMHFIVILLLWWTLSTKGLVKTNRGVTFSVSILSQVKYNISGEYANSVGAISCCHISNISTRGPFQYSIRLLIVMLWSLETARFVFRIVRSLLNLTGTSAAGYWNGAQTLRIILAMDAAVYPIIINNRDCMYIYLNVTPVTKLRYSYYNNWTLGARWQPTILG